MPSISEFERLFLLEFFVDSVYIKNSSVEDVNDSSLCVSFQFLFYPVMLVCEEDFAPKTKSLTKGTSVIFKSGKSCLFSMRNDQSTNMPPEFDLKIQVIQNMRKSSPPGKSFVGEAIVKLGSSFTNLMKSSCTSTLPTAFVKQDSFPLNDKTGQQVGNIASFIRLSCFGKLIVTQFQLGGEDSKNYMFKGTDPKKIFTDDDHVIKPISSSERHEDEAAEEEIPGDTPYKDLFGFPKESEESMKKEHDATEGSGDQEGPEESKVIREQETKDIQEPHEIERGEKEEDYKEIGAEINGNSITIRVLKKAKRIKKKSAEEVTQISPLTPHPIDFPPPCPCQVMPRCPPQTPVTCPQGCPPSCCPPVCPPPSNCCSPPSTCPQGCPSNCCPPPGCPPSCCPPPPCPPPCPANCCPPPGCPPSCCPPPACPPCPPNFCPPLACPPGGMPYSQGGLQTGYPQMQSMNLQQCPKEDCPLGLYNPNPQQSNNPNPMDLEPGTVAMKGDQVIFQMANRPVGEMISERERKLANAIYYKLASSEAGKEGMRNTVQIAPQNAGEPFAGVCPGGGPVSGLPIDNKQDMFLLKVQQNCDGVDAKSKLEMELRTPKTKEPKPETYTKNTQYVTTDFPAPEKKAAEEKGKKKKK